MIVDWHANSRLIIIIVTFHAQFVRAGERSMGLTPTKRGYCERFEKMTIPRPSLSLIERRFGSNRWKWPPPGKRQEIINFQEFWTESACRKQYMLIFQVSDYCCLSVREIIHHGDVWYAQRFPSIYNHSKHKTFCMTFMQCWTNVEDVGPALYKCYTNVLCLLGCGANIIPASGERRVVAEL